MNEISEQYQTRQKYQRIRCPECNGTSKIASQHIVDRQPGLQIRECSKCGNVFIYDYVMEADYQSKYWRGVIPR